MQYSFSLRVETTDSTNRLAREWARAGAPDGAYVVADAQTGGKGRRGRAWASAPGLGLWLSAILRPRAPRAAWPLLAYAAALAASDALAALTGAVPFIKWPNDLLLCGRKVCGILLETEGDAVVAGVGINLRHTAADFPQALADTAISVQMACGKAPDARALEAALMERLLVLSRAWDFLPDYRARCGTLGRAVRAELAAETLCGTATDITEDGALLLALPGGETRRVLAGDVRLRDGGEA